MHHRKTGRPMILSTGMSDLPMIEHAVDVLNEKNLILLHCTSTYPSKLEELNLSGIATLGKRFPTVPIGYSGHEPGLGTTLAAVAVGACVIERHITLDRAMWGSDQAASVEPQGIQRLVRDIRAVEAALGDGHIRIYDSERPIIDKLRRIG
jgi:N-acetylneuraminate synthase